MTRLLLALAFAGLTTTMMISCKKESTLVTNSETEELANAQDDIEQVDADADLIVYERGGGSGSCPTITWDQPAGTWPNRLVVDYGTACTLPDGRVVKGKLIVQQTDELRRAGATRTITFDGYAVDDVAFSGLRTRTNNSQNAAGQPVHSVVVNNLTRTFADGTTTVHNASHTFTMVSGSATPNIRLDDAFEIAGTGTFTGRGGKEYTTTILTPLRKENGCRWIVSGTASITRNGETTSVNFGTGACDRDAILTDATGNTRSIKLRR